VIVKSTIKIAVVFLIAVFVLIPGVVYSADWLSVNAYYKSFFTAYHQHEIESNILILDPTDFGAVSNRIRLDISANLNRNLILSTSYNFIPQIQDKLFSQTNLIPVGLNQFKYRFDDIDSRLYPSPHNKAGSFTIMQNLDRASLIIKTSPADIIIGRQPIAWGMAHVINPTDIIAPYAYEELDIEDRVGVDGVRLRAPLGFMGEMDAGIVFGEDFKDENNAMFFRLKYYCSKTDFSIILLKFRDNHMAGFNMARSIWGAGFWLEAAEVFIENENEKNFLRLSTGMDYSFSGRLYGFFEYHFNGAGFDEPRRYLNAACKTAYTQGSVYLLGKHYLIPGIVYQVTPLISVSADALTNLLDPSAYISMKGEYNVADDVYISAGMFIGVGERPEISNNNNFIPTLKLNSEFGAYPDIFFTSLKVYF